MGIIVWALLGTATELHHEKFKVATSALPTAQPARGEGRGMPAGKEGAAPVGARPQAGGGHLWEGEERWQGCDEGAAAARAKITGRNWPSHGQGRGSRLAKREQPQQVHDRGQEVDISGSGKRDAGLRAGSSSRECMTAGTTLRGGDEGSGMPDGEGGATPASA